MAASASIAPAGASSPVNFDHFTGLPVNIRRARIEAIVETCIAYLDAIDGDCDLEDDDPSGDPLDHGELGGFVHPEILMATLPLYGVDQSRGPINEVEAYRAHCLSEGIAA